MRKMIFMLEAVGVVLVLFWLSAGYFAVALPGQLPAAEKVYTECLSYPIGGFFLMLTGMTLAIVRSRLMPQNIRAWAAKHGLLD